MRSKITLFLILAVVLAGCTAAEPTPTAEANLPNPASVYCEEQGGVVEIHTDAEGNQSGMCIFPDGSECDEWAYFRGECAPGGAAPSANLPNPASVYCEEHGGVLEIRTDAEGNQAGVCVFPDGSECDEWAYFRGECAPGDFIPVSPAEAGVSLSTADDGCQLYTNAVLGYSFHFPADAQIVENAEPLKSFSIQGPLVNDEYWPVIFVAHPSDREDYLPPAEVNLEQWLADHNLVGETRLADTQIAGTTALHYRHDRSPQSYAHDQYFFAHAGQLYSIVILHTGDKEDWELYNHFLGSFQFED
jgi:hypothetical protein